MSDPNDQGQGQDKRKGRMVYDPEITAMNDVAETLEGLAPPARARVLQYLANRYGPDWKVTYATKTVFPEAEPAPKGECR